MRVNQFPGRAVRLSLLIVMSIAAAGVVRPQRATPESQADSAGAPEAPESVADVAPGPRGVLPEAPEPAFIPQGESSSLQASFSFDPSLPGSWAVDIAPNSPERVALKDCPTDTTHARECRVHWRQLLISSAVFNAFQNAGNVYTGYWYRWETTHGKWFERWFNSDLGWDWNDWTDGNPAMDQYVGHPFMGGITNSLWIQNDPKGAAVEIGEPGYWKSRMRATLFTTIYHFQWKFGPFGEAGVGHIGDHPTHNFNSHPRNDTGIVELVTTPVGGLGWTMAEDAIDKHVVKSFEQSPRRPVSLLLISFLTPTRATANILRWRAPWYRDDRQVRVRSFWADPPGAEEAASDEGSGAEGSAAPPGGVQPARNPAVLPLWPHYGGVHEFGAWWGASLMTGHVWGYAKDVKYMPIDVSYSYRLHSGANWDLRYAPELTALAMLDEPLPKNPNRFTQRKRTYGSGLSPVGFRTNFFSESRVQPFLSTDGGFIYFIDRVLSPQGSQWMYTIDFGGGLQIFRKQRQAVSIGYRYQHLSNANISLHNPGTDTNVFYVAVSRFRTKGYR
jgi:Lipid A 3-O-deacylase (PagL)